MKNRKKNTSQLPHKNDHALPPAPPLANAGQTSVIKGLEYPAGLPPLAQDEWNRIVGELTVLGVLSKFDRATLAVYCGAYAIWVDSMENIQKYGTMIKSPNGYPTQSPYVSLANRQADIMMKIAGEFGFTPASRSRNFSFSKSKSMLLESPPYTTGELGDL